MAGGRMTPYAQVRTGCLLAGILLAAVGTAQATGFFINQQSVQGRGRVDAGDSAAADELGTVFFNPAGLLTLLQPSDGSWHYAAGIQLIIPRATQRNAGTSATVAGVVEHPVDGPRSHNPTDPTPVPDVYVGRRLGDRAAVGFGVNVPFGLDETNPRDWFGRYDAIEAALRTVNLTAVAAYELAPGWAIGGGLDLQYANTRLVTAIPDPLAPEGPTPATDGRVETRGHAWTAGFNVGLLYTQDQNTRWGAHYRSGMKHEIKGSATFSNLLGPFAALNGTFGARADLRLPAVATAGFWRRITEKVAVMGEAEWYQWSRFHEIRTRFDGPIPDGVRVTNYRDTFGLALGADYCWNDAWTLRGGIKYDRTPTRDGFRDTTVPDSDRLWLGAGASWKLSERSSLDFALNHVFFRDTQVDATRTFFDGQPVATSVRTRADVRSVVNTVAFNFRSAF
jgi:long-chain fatty acid transport protein